MLGTVEELITNSEVTFFYDLIQMDTQVVTELEKHQLYSDNWYHLEELLGEINYRDWGRDKKRE